MAERNSLDLGTDPRAIIATRLFGAPRALVFAVWPEPGHLAQFPSAGERDRVIAEYGADKGLVQTLGRLAAHLAKLA